MSDDMDRTYIDVDPFFKTEAMSLSQWKRLMGKLTPQIGWLVVRFNALEAFVVWMLQEYVLAGRPAFQHRVWIVTHSMSYSQKVTCLMQMLWEYERMDASGTVKKQMKELEARLRRAGRLRNIVVHANYDDATAEGYLLSRVRVTRENGTEFEYAKIGSQLVRQFASEVEVLTGDLEDLAEEFFNPEQFEYSQERSNID